MPNFYNDDDDDDDDFFSGRFAPSDIERAGGREGVGARLPSAAGVLLPFGQ